jgi:translation initiation factor IF-2
MRYRCTVEGEHESRNKRLDAKKKKIKKKSSSFTRGYQERKMGIRLKADETGCTETFQTFCRDARNDIRNRTET